MFVVTPITWVRAENDFKQATAISLENLSHDSMRIAPPLLPENKYGSEAAIISSPAKIKKQRFAVGCLLMPTLYGDKIQGAFTVSS